MLTRPINTDEATLQAVFSAACLRQAETARNGRKLLDALRFVFRATASFIALACSLVFTQSVHTA